MYKILLVNPKIHINTGWAFSQINPKPERISHEETIKQPVSSWKDQLTNDFEEAIFLHHPSIAAIKNHLYKTGAAYSSMTGTGSTVFALFEKQLEPDLNFPNHYFVRWVN
jgi:4-diphosphocytidyl-2-C-methyl-D-erythritol kinase